MEPDSEKILVKGNEAIAMAAIDSGCLLYFGYPITPQNDIPEYLSKHLPPLGGELSRLKARLLQSIYSWGPQPPEQGP